MRCLFLPWPGLVPISGEPPEAQQQAGCFTRLQARGAGIADRRQRRLIHLGAWIPVVGGVVRPEAVEPEPWLRAHAAVLASGRYRAVSHTTAAALWGWQIDDDLHVTRPGGRVHAGIHDHHLPLARGEVVSVHGVRVTTLARTVTDLMTGLGHDDAIRALADGFRRGLFEPSDLVRAADAASGRYGAPQARGLAESCRGGPYSFLEWEFHQIAWFVAPDGWVFNVPIRDDAGLIGIVDALHVTSGTVVEVDGRAFHVDRFHSDRTRDQRLAGLGLLPIRVTNEDLRTPMLQAERLHRILASRPQRSIWAPLGARR